MPDNNKAVINDRIRQGLNSFTVSQCLEVIELLQARIKQPTNADYKSYREKKISDLNLSIRPHNALGEAEITTVGKLLDYGMENLANLKNNGPKSVKGSIERSKPDKD